MSRSTDRLKQQHLLTLASSQAWFCSFIPNPHLGFTGLFLTFFSSQPCHVLPLYKFTGEPPASLTSPAESYGQANGAGWNWQELTGTNWNWLELTRNIWNWLELTETDWKQLELIGASWNWLELTRTSWNWLEPAGTGCVQHWVASASPHRGHLCNICFTKPWTFTANSNRNLLAKLNI